MRPRSRERPATIRGATPKSNRCHWGELRWRQRVLRDAPSGRPQHEDRLDGIKESPHPEAPCEARPRRTQSAYPEALSLRVNGMLEYKGYIGVVEAEDGVFVGRIAGLRDVVTFEGTTFAEVEQAFRDSIDDYLAFCAVRGEPPRPPLHREHPIARQPGSPPPGGDARLGRRSEPQSADRAADRDRNLRPDDYPYSAAAAARFARFLSFGSSRRLRKRIDFGVTSTSSSSAI